ncbi:MAG: serine/threonine protein kinase, partial [Methyloversatilis sp.]|nr:serine/threonine protein kinase [Methyloversatilis sp.]
ENIAYAPTPTPSAIDPDVPPDLDRVVMRALAKSPIERYADASALAEALRGVKAVPVARDVDPLPDMRPADSVPEPVLRRGQSGKPKAPVEDVLAELAADIDAFSARGAPQPSIGQAASASAQRPLREQAPPAVAFPTLHETPAPLQAPPPSAPAVQRAAPAPADPPVAASSLLADLAGEAQRIRAHTAQMQRGERAVRTEAEQALSDRLLLVRDYLTQLSAQLNVIKPQVARDYPLLGLGVLRGLAWQASDVNTRNRGAEAPDQLVRVSLSWLLRGQAVLRCERDPLAADALRLALREHGLRFEEQPARDELNRLRAQIFDVAPEVRGRVELNADYRTLTLRLTLQNVERFGLVDYVPPAEDRGSEWLDELVRLLLGQPSRFPTLAKLIVPSPM